MRNHVNALLLMALSLILVTALSLSAQNATEYERFQNMDRQAGGTNLEGYWAPRMYEEQFERAPGRELGDYLGLPINDAARKRAEAYKGSFLTMPEWQCRPMQGDSIWRGPATVKFSNVVDPVTRKVIGIKEEGSRTTERTIWLDGRPRPPDIAPHDWNGFSTGQWIGDTLSVTTTHMKEGYVERNGLPRSDLATFRQHFIRYGDWLTVVNIVYDPVYLTEPFILTSEYEWDPHQVMTPYPCTMVEESSRPKGDVPHWLPGTSPVVKDFAEKYHVPVEAARGGAETAYPEYRLKMNAAVAPSRQGAR